MWALKVVGAVAVLTTSSNAIAEEGSHAKAQVTPGEGRDCFRANSVRRYAVIDDHSVRVRFTRSRSYTLTTSENAADLDFGRRLRLTSDTGWVCTGDVRGAVYVTGGDMGNRYAVDTVSRDPYPPPAAPDTGRPDAERGS